MMKSKLNTIPIRKPVEYPTQEMRERMNLVTDQEGHKLWAQGLRCKITRQMVVSPDFQRMLSTGSKQEVIDILSRASVKYDETKGKYGHAKSTKVG